MAGWIFHLSYRSTYDLLPINRDDDVFFFRHAPRKLFSQTSFSPPPIPLRVRLGPGTLTAWPASRRCPGARTARAKSRRRRTNRTASRTSSRPWLPDVIVVSAIVSATGLAGNPSTPHTPPSHSETHLPTPSPNPTGAARAAVRFSMTTSSVPTLRSVKPRGARHRLMVISSPNPGSALVSGGAREAAAFSAFKWIRTKKQSTRANMRFRRLRIGWGFGRGRISQAPRIACTN